MVIHVYHRNSSVREINYCIKTYHRSDELSREGSGIRLIITQRKPINSRLLLVSLNTFTPFSWLFAVISPVCSDCVREQLQYKTHHWYLSVFVWMCCRLQLQHTRALFEPHVRLMDESTFISYVALMNYLKESYNVINQVTCWAEIRQIWHISFYRCAYYDSLDTAVAWCNTFPKCHKS